MEKLKEYRILKEIPGTSNMVDTFVKQEHFSLTQKADGKVVSFPAVILCKVHIGDLNDKFKEQGEYEVLDVNPLILQQKTVDKLVEHGYIEEYVDKFLT